MQITLTSMQGNTRNIELASKQEVYDFIKIFKSTLHKNQRIKITCDVLSIDGYLQGNKQDRCKREGSTPSLLVCSLLFLLFIFYNTYHTSPKNIPILQK